MPWSWGTETADTTCAFSGSISGSGKSIEIRLRMCGPSLFQLYMLVASLNTVVIICLLHGSAVDSAILRLIFATATVQKWTVKVLFFCSFTTLCMRVPKMGPPGCPVLGPYLQGSPQLVSKNHISFRCKKRTQKLASCTFLS